MRKLRMLRVGNTNTKTITITPEFDVDWIGLKWVRIFRELYGSDWDDCDHVFN